MKLQNAELDEMFSVGSQILARSVTKLITTDFLWSSSPSDNHHFLIIPTKWGMDCTQWQVFIACSLSNANPPPIIF